MSAEPEGGSPAEGGSLRDPDGGAPGEGGGSLRDPDGGSPGEGAGPPLDRSDGSPGDPDGGSLLLLRCPTPTNFLCPCGAVERRLRRLGLDHRVERVPYRRRGARPEVVELTGQSRVPVLVDGDEVVSDSKRILQYLEWRYDDSEERD